MTTPIQIPSTSKLPYRQIRASYDEEHIIVYQAYNQAIATAAVSAQKLNASPLFQPSRMTWIKPSWCWMMYRSGYSYKDPNQAHILALKMTRAHFIELLGQAILAKDTHVKGETVVVQWDPERGPRLERFGEVRSVQIGIPGKVRERWVEEWIVGIEDVTERARGMKKMLDEDAGEGKAGVEELVGMGLMPVEREFVVPEEIFERLRMG